MSVELPSEVFAALRKHWGYSTLRPLQAEAVAAGLAGRDSLVVLPTGGGKSLCYQLPAVVRGGLTVVISPLIALMKDQVDSLTRMGIPAVRLDSSLDSSDRDIAYDAIRSGEARLAFVSPERLVGGDITSLFRAAGVHSVAIDEAHCVSHWGHDFRPEYRQLARLHEFFPGTAVHAFTATATKKVQADILQQLQLKHPLQYVGHFDRPNLTFRVLPQIDVFQQVCEVINRHKGSGGIVYCLRRKDVDDVAAMLIKKGYKAAAYHAGMSPHERKTAQDAFVKERVDVVVATIAFGMGIDRSNVRFVVHAAMPKSIEHYQQETGRAGRDGLPAECVLLFSVGDIMSMKKIVTRSNDEKGVEPAITAATLAQIEEMARFCRGAICRHKAIVNYFGQDYEPVNCGACDICLGDLDEVHDSNTIVMKILSCVARVEERFGINHVIEVLRGSRASGVVDRGHDKLSTWGLLADHNAGELRDYVHQLVGQGMLLLSEGEYPVLKLKPTSWQVMKKERTARLMKLRSTGVVKATKGAAERPAGVDDALFESLRQLRKQISTDDNVPPYLIFNDNVLLEFARGKPGTPEAMRRVSGVGDKKLRDYGEAFLAVIRKHCETTGTAMDVPLKPVSASPTPVAPTKMTPNKNRTFELFEQGFAIEDVTKQSQLSRSTVVEHLAEYITRNPATEIRTWIPEEVELRIRAVAKQHGTAAMKPVYQALEEKVGYDMIRIVFAKIAANSS